MTPKTGNPLKHSKNWTEKCFPLICLFLLPIFAAVLNSKIALAEETIIVQLRWFHGFQAAGYYAALEKGFYREKGFDVEIREGGTFDKIEHVVSGEAHYGVASSELVLERINGKPVVVLAAIFQHSPHALIARKSDHINTPHDLVGRRVMMSMASRAAELQAMFLGEGISLNQIQTLPDTDAPPDYADQTISAYGGYITNEPYYFHQQNIPVTLIRPQSYGIDFYGDCLFTSEREVNAHPNRVIAIIEASIRGWEYAIDQPEEIVDLIMKRYSPQKSRDHLLFEARKTKEIILPGIVEIGHINPGRWKFIADTYAKLGMTKSKNFSLEGFIHDPLKSSQERAEQSRKIILLLSILMVVMFSIFLLLNRALRRSVASHTHNLTQEIKHRIEIEKALIESEEKFRQVFTQIPEYAYIISMEGRIINCSDSVLVRLGYQKNDIIGKSLQSIYSSKSWCRAKILFEQWMRDGKIENEELNVISKNGNERTVILNAGAVRDSAGKILYSVSVQTDITERKQMEEQLRFQAKLLEIVEQSVIATDPHGRITYWNPFAEKLFGWSADQAIGKSILNLISSDESRQFGAEIMLRLQSGKSWSGEILVRRQDGTLFTIQSSTAPIFENDRLVGIIGISSDITERKQTEAALQVSEERFRLLFENMLNGFAYHEIILDEDGKPVDYRFLEVNTAFERLTGLKKDQVIGKLVSDVIPEFDWIVAYDTVALTGNQLIFERYSEALGRWYAVSSYSYQKGYLASIFQDITERKKAEEELKNRNEWLKQAVQDKQQEMERLFEKYLRQEKLATIGKLTGSIAHELRNPLGAARNSIYYLKQLAQKGNFNANNPKVQKHLSLIEMELSISAQVITDVLELTRIKPLQYSEGNLREQLQNAISYCNLPIEIQILMDIEPEPFMTWTDPIQFRQVLINLLTNAIHAIGEKGRITIRARKMSDDDAMMIEIMDTGVGIEPSNRNKIFEPLFTTKATGTGLGLPVCKQIVENHNGQISITSQYGMGTTVKLILPLSPLKSHDPQLLSQSPSDS